MAICLERGADLHMAQLMPLPLTVSCFSKIQTGFTFLVLAYPGGPGKRAFNQVCVYIYVIELLCYRTARDDCSINNSMQLFRCSSVSLYSANYLATIYIKSRDVVMVKP